MYETNVITLLQFEMSQMMMEFLKRNKKNCIVYTRLNEVRMYGTDSIIWGIRWSIGNERLLVTKLTALDCISIN